MQININDCRSNSASANRRLLQDCLDVGGQITVLGSGRLFIDDTVRIRNDTTLRLDDDVRLSLEPNVNRPLIMNADPVLGNKNIAVEGGTLDYDCEQQSPKGGTLLTMAAIFQRVRGLRISGVRGVNARKYVFLAAGCDDVTFEDIVFDTPSDGIHIQGPSKRVVVRNVSGRTGDDMVAFTIGDYPGYELSRGDIEDVLVENVRPDGSKSGVKLAGNPGFGFRRIAIKDLRGRVRDFMVICLVDRNLDETVIEDLSIEGLQADITTEKPSLFVGRGTRIGSLSVKHARFVANGEAASGAVLHFNEQARIDQLNLHDLAFVGNDIARPGRIRASLGAVSIDGLQLDDMRGDLVVEHVGETPCRLSIKGVVANGEPGTVQTIGHFETD